MTLSPLDDYPVHQAAEVMRHVVTSDRNFYDRYYFNLMPTAGDRFVVFGHGQYPNLGTTDAFVCVTDGHTHRVVRSSKALGDDRMDTTVGPLRVEVVEPLRKLRVVCEPNEWDVQLDATFEGVIPATLEPRHFNRELERVIFDTQRLAQTGRWTGRLAIENSEIEIEPDGWWGYRDRSWGVRPVGEAEAPGRRAAVAEPGTFFWCYTPLQLEDHSLLVMIQEDRKGRRILEAAMRVWNDAARPVEHLGRPEHDVEFHPGTRAPKRVMLSLSSGLGIEIEPVLPCYLLKGTGYGVDETWRHGAWQGEQVTEGASFDLGDPDVQASLYGLLEHTARVTTSEGQSGWGMLEFACVGPHDRYGFEGYEDLGLWPT